MSKLVRRRKFTGINNTNFTTESSNMWIDKYKPKTISDLAVHSKKIVEVKSWIAKHSGVVTKSPMLLLTGPCGSAKSATMSVIADTNLCSWEDSSLTNEMEDFSDFLLKASRFDNCEDFEKGNQQNKIILIENLPTKLFDEPNVFHELLISYKSARRHPLVIILSDSQNLKYSSHWLIPKWLQEKLEIDVISFNPISATMMKKAIQNIARQERGRMSESNQQDIISHICNISNGDIRSAINNLQIYLTSSNYSDKQAQMSKDTPLFVFRALGKILYCKRETDETKVADYRNQMMCTLVDPSTFRAPLLFNPEQVFDTSGLEPSTFVNYLHENYLDFINDIEQVDQIADDFSLSDALFNRWTPDHKDTFKKYMISTVTRSMMYHNESKNKNAWRPLHKSSMGDIHKTSSATKSKIMSQLFDKSNVLTLRHILVSNELFVQTLPLMMKMTTKSEIKSLSGLRLLSFDKPTFGSKGRKLDEDMPVDFEDTIHHSSWRTKPIEHEWKICKYPNEDNVSIEIDY